MFLHQYLFMMDNRLKWVIITPSIMITIKKSGGSSMIRLSLRWMNKPFLRRVMEVKGIHVPILSSIRLRLI